MSESLKTLGDRLRRARVESGLSQAQLGAPHFTRAYVSALELGKIRPAMKSLEFLATKLGKPAGHFLEDEEKEKRRREREMATAQASQLIAEGKAKDAASELLAIDQEGLPLGERLNIKRLLGRAYLESAEGSKAASMFTEALRGFEAMKDQEQVARTRAQLGTALISLMSYDEAQVHLSEALRATAAGIVKDPLFRVHTLHSLGVTYYQRGDYRSALDQFELAALEGADIADQKWLASLYAAMGMSRRQVGDYEAAITCLRKSEALFDAIHNRSRVAEIRFQMARTLRAIGSKTKAESMLVDAISAAQSAGNEILAIRIQAFRGLSRSEDGDQATAAGELQRLVQTADALGDLGARFTARFTLAKVLARVDPPRAETILRETIAFLEKVSARPELADTYDELSRVLASQGRAQEALAYSQRAFEMSRSAQERR